MSNRVLAVLIAVLAVVLLIAGMSVLNKNRGEESSESSHAVLTDVIIVPSEMPKRITFELPPGFTEKNSEAYDKYYVRDDASVIVTGEEMTIKGIRLDEYVDSVKAQYAQTADRYSLLSEQTVGLSGGVQCTVLEFTYSIIGEDAQQGMQCITAIMLKDNRSYIVTCKSRQESFSVYRSSFMRMIESIHIADRDAETSETTAAVLN